MEGQRLFSRVKLRLGLETKLRSADLFQISKPPPNPTVPTIDLAPRCGHRGLELDLRVAKRNRCVRVVPVEGLNCEAMKTDIRIPGSRDISQRTISQAR